MQRRRFLQAGAAASMLGAAGTLLADDDRWGAARGYPTGWSGGYERDTYTRVGNYSGGFEQMLPSRTIRAATSTPAPLRTAPRNDFRYRWGLFEKSVDDYMASQPATALAFGRDGAIWCEKYGYGRQAEMRMTSWSMAKSVTSLLLGIAIDKGLIASLDDPAERYVPALAGTLHGQVAMRQLVNMSSGAAILQDRDNATIYPAGLQRPDSDLEAVVRGWNTRLEDPGTRFNYNELCPLTIGMVLRAVTGKSLADYATESLWQPMGAEADATWQCDSHRHEFNCIGVAARVKDWLRLGQLVAQQGEINGTQIVSKAWLAECCSWRADEQQVGFGRVTPNAGYKAFMWHARSDGSQPFFNGHHGQRVFVDLPTRTVLVHTAVDQSPLMMRELYSIFAAAVAEKA